MAGGGALGISLLLNSRIFWNSDKETQPHSLNVNTRLKHKSGRSFVCFYLHKVQTVSYTAHNLISVGTTIVSPSSYWFSMSSSTRWYYACGVILPLSCRNSCQQVPMYVMIWWHKVLEIRYTMADLTPTPSTSKDTKQQSHVLKRIDPDDPWRMLRWGQRQRRQWPTMTTTTMTMMMAADTLVEAAAMVTAEARAMVAAMAIEGGSVGRYIKQGEEGLWGVDDDGAEG